MKKGYYLSVFSDVGEVKYLENIKLRHDHAIALWKYDGNLYLEDYWELERFSGMKKHSKAFYDLEHFESFVNEMLKKRNISLDDIVEIWGTKGIESNTIYRERYDSDIAFHSIAHLLTSIYYRNKNPFNDNIIALSLDAGPDSLFEENAYNKNYYAGGVIKNGELHIERIESPGAFWSFLSKYYGMGEGTLMALGNAMETYYNIDLSKYNDYRFWDKNVKKNAEEIVLDIIKQVEGLQVSNNDNAQLKINDNFTVEENIISIVIKVINELSYTIVKRNIDYLTKKYNICTKNSVLALSGGFALNCPTNTRLLLEYDFKRFQIPPCTSDTGIALGIGLAGFKDVLSKCEFDWSTPYLGNKVSDLENVLKNFDTQIVAIKEVNLKEIVDDIISDGIIIWINDRAEIGPRALGNRSILGDPRSIKVKDELNKIKKREWWRPVAPVVMDEYGEKYFMNYRYSPDMLLNFQMKCSEIDNVLAIVHLDNTARVQSVSVDSNEVLYNLLKEFQSRTKVPILCNTSLNDCGEPIINTLEEAIEFALRKNMKSLYLNGKYKIILNENEEYWNTQFSIRKYFENKKIHEKVKDINSDVYNPHKLNIKELTYYYDNPDIMMGLDIKNKEDSNIIREKTKSYLSISKYALIR